MFDLLFCLCATDKTMSDKIRNGGVANCERAIAQRFLYSVEVQFIKKKLKKKSTNKLINLKQTFDYEMNVLYIVREEEQNFRSNRFEINGTLCVDGITAIQMLASVLQNSSSKMLNKNKKQRKRANISNKI